MAWTALEATERFSKRSCDSQSIRATLFHVMSVSDPEVRYGYLRPEAFRRRIADAPVAYVPLGTLEWHGEHLPYGSDSLQAELFFLRLARVAGGIVLPPLFLGPDITMTRDGTTYIGMDFYGHEETPDQLEGSAYWVDDTLFAGIIDAVLANLRRTGFRVAVLHGHGPSTTYIETNAAELSRRHGLTVLHCRRPDERDGHGLMTDHAGVNETSLMMTLAPDLVDISALPTSQPLRGMFGGDPRTEAAAEIGEAAVNAQIERMTAILRSVVFDAPEA